MNRKLERMYALRVGVFVIITLILFTIAVTMLSGKFGMFADTVSVKAHFSDVGGLLKGAPVYFLGVEVGKVKDLKIVSSGKVEVVMKIGRKEAKNIPSDSVATLRTLGVLGDVVVEIKKGTSSEPIKEGMNMKGEPLKTIPQAFEVFEVLGERMTEVAESIKKITEDIAKGRGTLGKLVKDPSLYERVLSMIARLEKASEEIKKTAEELQNQKVAMKISATFERLEEVSKNLEEITRTIRANEGTVGKLVKDDEIYKDLRNTVKELRELIIDIKKNPKRYLTIKIF